MLTLGIPDYRELARIAMTLPVRMSTTYLAEKGFSKLVDMKTKKAKPVTRCGRGLSDEGPLESERMLRFESIFHTIWKST